MHNFIHNIHNVFGSCRDRIVKTKYNLSQISTSFLVQTANNFFFLKKGLFSMKLTTILTIKYKMLYDEAGAYFTFLPYKKKF